MDLEGMRQKILPATLERVPVRGWTSAALKAGAVDAGYDAAMALNAFPGEMVELAEYFNACTDRRMIEELERRGLATMKVRDRISTAVRVRLEQIAPRRKAYARLLAYLAMPHNVGIGLKCLYRTVDAMWYAAGDTSTDYNFYTKRALLAGVYSTTVLYWLNDNSEGFQDSWTFLDRRIADIMRFPQSLERARKFLQDLPFSVLQYRTRTKGKRPESRRV